MMADEIKIEEIKEFDVSNAWITDQLSFIRNIAEERVSKVTLYKIKVSQKLFTDDDYSIELTLLMRAIWSDPSTLIKRDTKNSMVILVKKPTEENR